MNKKTISKYPEELELEEFLMSLADTLSKISLLSYRYKYTDNESYKLYRKTIEMLQKKRDTAKASLRKLRLNNLLNEANTALKKTIK